MVHLDCDFFLFVLKCLEVKSGIKFENSSRNFPPKILLRQSFIIVLSFFIRCYTNYAFNQLTPRSTVNFQELTVVQLVKKLSTFYKIKRYVIMFMKVCQCQLLTFSFVYDTRICVNRMQIKYYICPLFFFSFYGLGNISMDIFQENHTDN